MRTKADTRLIVERLKKEYPVSECSLAYDDAWQLLVSVRLSAQCTDARVNIVTKDLFAKYPTLEALAAAGPDAIEAIIKPCGLGKSKARDLAGMANMLLREYGGKVPQAMEDLLRLPGVGRKSANLIRGDIFHLPAVVADTHCIRMANRIGFVTDTTDPVQVERALVKVLPPGVHRPQGSVRGVLPAGRLPHWQKNHQTGNIGGTGMKRTLSLALCLILSLALLAGCGAAPLPDGLTQESVTDAAAQTVAQLNDEDYDALFAGMTEEMTSAMTAEDLAAVWQPVLEAAGAFDSITKTTVGGKDGYGVAVVQAKYENAAVTFTLSYTPEGKLGGLFFK